MSKQNQAVETKTDKQNRLKVAPAVIPKQVPDPAALVNLPPDPTGAAGDGSIEAQVARLSDRRFQPVQRRAIAAHIGQAQGNRHLERLIVSNRRDNSTKSRQLHQVAVPIGVISRQSAGEPTGEQPGQQQDRERVEILAGMTGEMNPPAQLRTRMLDAMRGFSIRQLNDMKDARVRFWGPGELPTLPEAAVFRVAPMQSPARYLPEVRVIQVHFNVGSGHIRHEMAHAWDHVRRFNRSRRRQRHLEPGRPVRLWSDSPRIRRMYELYRRRARRRELAFDNPGTREGHSLSSPKEFYAEGYSVFHGPHQSSQARLLYYAPELFGLLEREAQRERMPLPDRAILRRLIDELRLPRPEE